ncbi:MAG: PLP-dependent transferase [Planctomycetes bacterium]|nr:PLP-dependent transferase [Planctomycetota bacterium]
MSTAHASSSALHPATLCIHAGWRATPERKDVVLPIAQAATFLLDDASYAAMLEGRIDEAEIYTRLGNPTLDAVQTKLAALEGAEHALLFASGMAAIHAALLSRVRTGSRVVAQKELYGSAWDLLENFLRPLGVATEFVELNDPAARKAALAQGCDVVYCESVSNPTLAVADLPAIAKEARAAGAVTIVDATFATPLLQKPLELGADLVVHSATKYLAGHSDVIGGVVLGSRERLKPVYRWLQLAGGCMDPHAAFLLDRGLKTLPLRMKAHVENACELARFFGRHPKVERVLYPGLESHPSHGRARTLLAGPGGMVSCVVRGGDAAALACLRRLKLALEASSLGGAETLVSAPFNTSHARLSPAQRAAAGIPPGFLRISAGIEDARDLVRDFEQALAG